jgi:uncharacterized membrane protein YciS (DUF1049 family)
MPIYVLFALIIAFFAIAFALQNNSQVVINLLFWQTQESLALVLLITLALGFIIGLLVMTPTLFKRGWRLSRVHQQAADLETQLLEKERATATQRQMTESLRQSYQNLLQALQVTEPTTGLLSHQLLPKTVTALLHQMRLQPRQIPSVTLLILAAEPSRPLSDQAARLWVSVAHEIQHRLTVDSWLHSNGQGQFICTLNGFDLGAVNQYAETLKQALTEKPWPLEPGEPVRLQVSIGGVLADSQHPAATAQQLIEQAQTTLQQSHDRIRIVRAAT